MPLQLVPRQGDDITDRVVEVEPVLLRGRFLRKCANPADDVRGVCYCWLIDLRYRNRGRVVSRALVGSVFSWIWRYLAPRLTLS